MPDTPQVVHVSLGQRSYDIEIGSGNLGQVGRLAAGRGELSHAVVVTDKNVEEPHARKVVDSLGELADRIDLVVIDPGEEAKSVETASALWSGLVELKADRKSLLVAVGGGVIGDLAGFVAATFARGIDLFQVPTSLLAQVDSSVGGKVGINLPSAKNMVGAFLQPRGVLIDTATLDTLPKREYLAGLAEVVKYGVILDAELFAQLEGSVEAILRRDHATLRPIIARCCRLKADVVQQDEREITGLRAVLNYGHTFAHAFETLTGYGTLLHGEAVSIGMECAAHLAERLGRVDAAFTARQRALLVALGLPIAVPKLDVEQVMATMMHDKKVAHGRLRFVLPTKLGHVELAGDIPSDAVRASLEP